MIALQEELDMATSLTNMQEELSMDRPRRLPMEMCGPYAGEEEVSGHACCWLRIGHANVSIQLPTEVMRDPCLLDRGPIVLHVPHQRPIPVETQVILTDSQQKRAAGWAAEMADFDRF
jgi:hypothetical protein